MTLSDVTIPVGYEWGRNHALVFTQRIAARLQELHASYGSTNCVPVPLSLSDGRLMLSADVLTEVTPGGLLHSMWAAADKSVLLTSVEVVPLQSVVSLIPKPLPMPYE